MDNSVERNKRIEEIRQELGVAKAIHTMKFMPILKDHVEWMIDELSRLQVERDKAIEVLRWYGGHRFDDGEKARKIIKEISHDPLD